MPIDPPILLAFVATTLVLVLSPGPDTLLILRYTIGSGRRVGLAAVAGVQTGLALHTLAAVIGLSLLIATTPMALQIVATAGAAYLGWLGVQSLRAPVLAAEAPDAAFVGSGKAWRDAMLTNLLNPKVLLLFLALMPQFVTARHPAALQLTVLGATLIFVNTIWQTALTLAADRVRRWLVTATVQRTVSAATGVIFLLFAALLVRDYIV